MPRKKKNVKLFTLDTETVGLGGAIRRIAIYDGETVTYGYNFADVEHILETASEDYNVHCYIHNLNFDARKCPEIFRPDNVRWNMCLVINRKYATISCKKYTLHDSFQLLPMSLAKASKSFDLTHGKLDLWDEVQKEYPGQYKNHVDFLSRCHVDDPLYLKYLGFDVMALYELIMKIVDVSTIPLEHLVKCPTTASMSKYLIKNGFNGQPFISENRTKTDFEIMTANKYWLSQKPLKEFPDVSYAELEYKIREAYYGGRTEVFTPKIKETGETVNAYHYDVNSLYPYACLVNEYPVGVPDFYTDKTKISYKWRFWLKYHRGLGFMKCRVYIPHQKIPPLPSRLDKLCFLTGYVEGYWTFHEIEYAVKNCGVQILEMYEMVYFKYTFPVYKNFIQSFSDMKEQATIDENTALREFSKLIMNTAYGWTCMSRDDKTELDFISKKDYYRDKERLVNYDEELGFVEIKSIVRTLTIQVQVGAYVTSYARLILLDALRKQAEKGEVYYCDTDSIVCEKPMDEEMIDNVAIGKWGLENVVKKGLFLQPKLYVEETADKTNFKFKGVTKERQKSFTYEFYEEIYNALCNHQPGTITVEEHIERLPSLITAQKRQIDPNQIIITSKNLNLENTQKRNIDYKNNVSEPWYMPDIDYFKTFDFAKIDFSRGDFFEKRRK